MSVIGLKIIKYLRKIKSKREKVKVSKEKNRNNLSSRG